MIDLLGWICSTTMIAGGYGVAHKRMWGLYALLVGNIGWGWVGCCTRLWSLLGVSIAFALMDIYAIWRWRREFHPLVIKYPITQEDMERLQKISDKRLEDIVAWRTCGVPVEVLEEALKL